MIVRSWMMPCGGQESNIHLIACESTREAAIIDAGGFPAEMREEIKSLALRVTHVLITHGHHDHVDSLGDMMSAYPRAIVCATQRVSENTRIVAEGDTLQVGELRAHVIQTSGHTPDSISFVFGDEIVFCGDALFAGSIGGTSSARMRQEEITHIREKILCLPDDCEIRPGHGPVTTVGIERSSNPFLE
ncbi:MBL fold metallo-hydrolase [Candidatus Sumerlaeota bacterium]|nr:MBL fold metallo-hydrolase [Candidatus Sumerlaeota bacterium]